MGSKFSSNIVTSTEKFSFLSDEKNSHWKKNQEKIKLHYVWFFFHKIRQLVLRSISLDAIYN